MPELTLLFVEADHTIRKLPVVRADMVHPGWMRYELANTARPGADNTIVWEPVPAGGFAELQSHPTDDDMRAWIAQREDEATNAA